MIQVELSQEEADALGNCADLCMEQWTVRRADPPFASPQWRRATEEWEFWLHLSIRLGCRYEDVRAGERRR